MKNTSESAPAFTDEDARCVFRHRWNLSTTGSDFCPRCGGRPFTSFTSHEPQRGWGYFVTLLVIPAGWVCAVVLAISSINDAQWYVLKISLAGILFVACLALVFSGIVSSARYEVAVDSNRAKSLALLFNLTFNQLPSPEVVQIVTELDLFQKKKQPDFSAVLTGSIDGREVIGGRLSWWEGSDSEGSPMSKRLLIFPGLGKNLPSFELRSRGTLSQWFHRLIMSTSVFADRKIGRKFAERYSLKGSEIHRVREVFDEFLLECFAETLHWFISNDHGHMVFERTLPDQSFQFRTAKPDLEPPASHHYETWEMATVLASHFARRPQDGTSMHVNTKS